MSQWPNAILLAEIGLAIPFLFMVAFVRRKLGSTDALLWSLAWSTRVFASLNGSRGFNGTPSELGAYIALQSCAALSLMILLMRSELRVFKERTVKGIMLQVLRFEPGPEVKSEPRVSV